MSTTKHTRNTNGNNWKRQQVLEGTTECKEYEILCIDYYLHNTENIGKEYNSDTRSSSNILALNIVSRF